MRIKQIIPADGWYVIRRDFESTGLSESERVWHCPLAAFVLTEDEDDGATWVEGLEVLGNEIEPSAGDFTNTTPGYHEFVRGEEALEEALEKHLQVWRTKPWEAMR